MRKKFKIEVVLEDSMYCDGCCCCAEYIPSFRCSLFGNKVSMDKKYRLIRLKECIKRYGINR